MSLMLATFISSTYANQKIQRTSFVITMPRNRRWRSWLLALISVMLLLRRLGRARYDLLVSIVAYAYKSHGTISRLQETHSLEHLFVSLHKNEIELLVKDASALDNLSTITVCSNQVSQADIDALVLYVARAQKLTELDLRLSGKDNDSARLFDSLARTDQFRCLKLSLNDLTDADYRAIQNIVKTSRINSFYFSTNFSDLSHMYATIDALSTSNSIVKCVLVDEDNTKKNRRSNIINFWEDATVDLFDVPLFDFSCIQRLFEKHRVLNDLEIVGPAAGYSKKQAKIDEIKASCLNLERLDLNSRIQWPDRREEINVFLKTMYPYIEITRVLASGNPGPKRRLPRELLEIILISYIGQGWYRNQLVAIITALLDRRTLGLVYGDILPLSKSYLYVRCRDALLRIRTSCV